MIQPHDSVIVTTLGRVLIPLAQVFGVYVLIFGQYGPGGGFVGGVILAATMILSILVFGPTASDTHLARRVLRLDGLGLLIFAGAGGLCLIAGGEFLNYAEVELFGLEPASRRYLGILLTQVGVAADVAVTGVSIAFSLSSMNNDEVAHG